jgi:hypothetical protein
LSAEFAASGERKAALPPLSSERKLLPGTRLSENTSLITTSAIVAAHASVRPAATGRTLAAKKFIQ